ncbi:hypothetical protein [Prescottella sp. R16]|uniref:hypothetical protein n=1 Tax=Prescottella sp. R16 TaxID=3064529 RepID=UPI00272E7613|nr:hypothetical protein [Prescottella sp. R16]
MSPIRRAQPPEPRWAWPLVYAGIIVLGLVLHITLQSPFWIQTVLALGIVVAFFVAMSWAGRRTRR